MTAVYSSRQKRETIPSFAVALPSSWTRHQLSPLSSNKRTVSPTVTPISSENDGINVCVTVIRRGRFLFPICGPNSVACRELLANGDAVEIEAATEGVVTTGDVAAGLEGRGGRSLGGVRGNGCVILRGAEDVAMVWDRLYAGGGVCMDSRKYLPRTSAELFGIGSFRSRFGLDNGGDGNARMVEVSTELVEVAD